MANDRRPSPDGDSGPAGADGRYRGRLTQDGQAAYQGPSVAPDNAGGWSDTAYRSGSAACYDPYVVESGGSARGDF